MKPSRFLLPAAVLLSVGLNWSCEDNVSPIGGSIAAGEVNISIDSLEYKLDATTIYNPSFDARSGNILLGKLNVPEYGHLDCSFVTRLLSISQLPDTITESQEKFNKFIATIDSCAVQLYMIRGNYVGDSIAPQQVKLFQLTKQLPDNITNEFDPTGYYDPSSPLGVKNYTLVNAGETDATYLRYKDFQIRIPVDTQYAVNILKKYMEDPEIFTWPSKFASFLPGFYMESSFGKGCMASFSRLTLNAYHYKIAQQLKKDDEGQNVKDENGNLVYETVHLKDSIVLCTTAPEVLSSNRISYTPSQSILNRIASGENIVTTPGGFTTTFKFPAEEIIKKYKDHSSNISVISGLSMTIPADTVKNDYRIYGAPYLLLIKTKNVEEFFASNSLPDNISSFYATYSSTLGGYRFPALRSYLLELLDKDELSDEDIDFSLIPVNITTESGANNSSYTQVIKCVPYTVQPTMTKLDTEHARIVFTFSSQMLE